MSELHSVAFDDLRDLRSVLDDVHSLRPIGLREVVHVVGLGG